MTSLTDMGLAEALRSQTRAAHESAESSPFMARLLDGSLPVNAYAALATQHLQIYTALEEIAPRHSSELGPFLNPALLRREHLLADLRALPAAVVVKATTDYVTHLHEVCGDWAGGYLAHHYVRYLGDLSGGQIVRRALIRTYPEVEGTTSFYAFADIPKPKPFKDSYRSALDSAPFVAEERERIVAEATVAFGLNEQVFLDLATQFC